MKLKAEWVCNLCQTVVKVVFLICFEIEIGLNALKKHGGTWNINNMSQYIKHVLQWIGLYSALYIVYNARMVISEMYAFLVQQCTFTGLLSEHKTVGIAWNGIHLSHNKPMKYSGHWKFLCELSKFLILNAFILLG